MEYQKIVNLLGNKTTQPSNFETKNWVEINDDACGTYSTNNQIKLKSTTLKSSLCDYSDALILVIGIITFVKTVVADVDANNTNKKAIFKMQIVLHWLIA